MTNYIHINETNKEFHLTNGKISYIFRVMEQTNTLKLTVCGEDDKAPRVVRAPDRKGGASVEQSSDGRSYDFLGTRQTGNACIRND